MPNPFPYQIRMVCITCGEHITSKSTWTPDGCLVDYRHAADNGGIVTPVYDHEAQPTPVPPEEYRKR